MNASLRNTLATPHSAPVFDHSSNWEKRAAFSFLALAAVVMAIPASAAINGVSAPRLLLSCLSLTLGPQNTAVLTCKVQNISTTSGGQAPTIQKVALTVGPGLYPMSNVSPGEITQTSLTFPSGTYQKGIVIGASGVAIDGIFGNTAGVPPGTQYVAANALVVIDPTQPPEPLLPGNPAGNCTYEATLSTTPLNFPAEGGSASLVVDTETVAASFPTGCPWTAGSHNGAANVVTFSTAGTQIGPGQAYFTVKPNRVVNGNTNPLTIVMPEIPSTPNAVDVIDAFPGAVGYHGSFQFSQDGLTCAYQASGFTAPQGGLSSANPGVVTITATGSTVPGDPSDGTKGIPDSNCQWSVTSSSPQVSIIDGGAVHTGSGTFQYTVTPNTGAARNLTFALGTALIVTAAQSGPTTSNVTMTTSPAGLSVVADNTTYVTPHTFQWATGSQHTIGTASPQSSGAIRDVFSSWSQGGTQNQTVTAAGDATYTANFSTQYQLTTSVSSAGSGTVTPASGGFYAQGSSVTLTAIPASGYLFTGWTGAVSSPSAPSTAITMNAPQSVTANFAPTVTVTVATNPAGRSMVVDSATYAAPMTFSWVKGSSHTFNVSSPQGSGATRYVFSSWSQGGAQSQTVTVTASATYTANFTTQYQLTASVSPAGSGTVTPASGGFYAQGSSVTLTATPASGYRFTGWTGAVSSPSAPATAIVMNAPQSATANFAPLTAIPLRIYSGGAAYTDPAGNVWLADTGFSGGATFTTSASIARTSTPALYQSDREGSTFSYQFTMPNGAYLVTLKFAELHSPVPARLFSVLLNDSLALNNFSPATVAGGAFTAVDEQFETSVAGNQLTILFYAAQGLAEINAIEVTPANIRVNSGGPAYTAPDGTVWSGDTGYSGGATLVTASPIAGTTTPTLYQTQRVSAASFDYLFPVPDGAYLVHLKFAEIVYTSPGMRVFDVSINGTQVLKNFDIVAQAGAAFKAIDEPFVAVVTNGALTIRFDPVVNMAAIGAIEILPSALIRIKSGGTYTTDSTGTTWSGDFDYSGGTAVTELGAFSSASDAALGQTMRAGQTNFDYLFPVPNGAYTVVLHTIAPVLSTGAPVFSVSINGGPQASMPGNVNPVVLAPGETLHLRTTSFPVTVTSGGITLQFTSPENLVAAVNAIEILPIAQ